MVMPRLITIVVFAIAAGGATPLWAQLPRPERPYRGLFGSTGTVDAEQTLTLNASVGAGYDDNLVAEARGGTARPSDLNTSLRGGVGQAYTALSYGLNRQGASIGASIGTSGRYYPSLALPFIRRDSAHRSAGVQLTESLSVNGMAAYQPQSLLSLFPVALEASAVESVTPDYDFAASTRHYVSYGGGIGYRSRVSARTTLSADYRYVASERGSGAGDFYRQSVGGQLTHQLGQGLGLRLGYRFSKAYYETPTRRPSDHLIDAGVDYRRRLSFSRRTSLSFGSGLSAASHPVDESSRTQFRAVGHVTLNHEIGRTWNAAAAYTRGLRMDESLPEPVFADAATISIVGLLSRRLQFRSQLQAATGQLYNAATTPGRFGTYYAGTALQYALSGFASLGANYSHYWHEFDDEVVLAPGYSPQVTRHSIRGYLNVQLPLWSRSRRD
jgi:hypothetical protein